MCVIAVYEKGTRPSEKDIKKMMLANADGAGVAWVTRSGVIEVHKGYRHAADVMRTIRAIPTDSPILFHARIATSGGISPAKCHPYPLTDRADLLDATDYTARVPVIAHNGVFSLTPAKGQNDSQTFIAQYMYPLTRRMRREFDRGGAFPDKLIAAMTSGSRLAVLFPDGRVRYFGQWIQRKGVAFSNVTFEYYGDYYTAPKYRSRWWEDYGWDDKDGYKSATKGGGLKPLRP